MIEYITTCILALATMHYAPVHHYHRQFRPDAKQRAPLLAEAMVGEGEALRIKPALVLALLWHEASFARDRVSSVGCISIAQLCGRARAGYMRECHRLRDVYECDRVAIRYAVAELRTGLDYCGSEAGAVSYYRSGRCTLDKTWRIRQVLALSKSIEWGMP